MKDQEASNHFGTMCNIYVIYPHVIMLGTLYIFLGINHVMVIISKSLVQFFFHVKPNYVYMPWRKGCRNEGCVP